MQARKTTCAGKIVTRDASAKPDPANRSGQPLVVRPWALAEVSPIVRS